MLASLVAVATTSCMAPLEPVDTYEHYARLRLEVAGSDRRRDWELMRNPVDHLLGWDSDRNRCSQVPVELPAVSADGRVLALGKSSRVGRWHDAAVEIISTETGVELASHSLPRVRNGGAMPVDEGCEAVGELAQWLEPGQFVPMLGVARTDFGFPDVVDPWIRVVSDGARQERSGGIDLVVVPASAVGIETLGVRVPPEGSVVEPRAFVSDHVAVFTESYVGC